MCHGLNKNRNEDNIVYRSKHTNRPVYSFISNREKKLDFTFHSIINLHKVGEIIKKKEIS